MSDYQIITAALANIIYVAVLYKLLHIFFTSTRSRRQELALYAAAYVLLTAAYVLWQKPEVTMASNVLVIFALTCFYPEAWIRRLTAAAFVFSTALLCEMTVVEVMEAVGFSRYDVLNDGEFVWAQKMCIRDRNKPYHLLCRLNFDLDGFFCFLNKKHSDVSKLKSYATAWP